MAPVPLSAIAAGGLQSLANKIGRSNHSFNPQKGPNILHRLIVLSASFSSVAGSFLSRSREMARSISLSSSSSSSKLHRREQMISIPSTYSSFTSSPGVVVGIVIGTVGGFVLFIWVLFLIFGGRTTAVVDDTTTVTADSRAQHSQSRRRRPEVVDVMSGSTSSSSDDVIEVFEEVSSGSHSPRRTKSKPSGSYRTTNPNEYGGGRAPSRHVHHR
ncbi:hypothetical protein GX48_04448 [Paracoccidioides brasiliensis]|nr:hypothetical protein GX48_04448 [Paracoccidioides brasiliensis]